MAPRRLPWLRGPTPATAAADTNIADSSLPTPGLFLLSSPPPHLLLGLGGSNSNPNIQLVPPPPPSPWPWPAAAYSSSSSSSSSSPPPSSSSPSSVRAHLDLRHHQTTKVLYPAPPHPANTQALGDDGAASINRRRRTTSTASTGSRGDRRRSRHPKFVSAARGYGRYLRRVMEYVAARLHQGRTAAAAATTTAVQLPHHHQIQVIGAADHRPPPLQTRNRGSATQRRRMDLEQEVAELKKQLSNEQTVHDILERALHPNSARSIVLNIPAFIPKKAKELLAEVVLVEEEIARLERQIDKMKGGLSAMQQERSMATSYPSRSQGTNGNGGTAAAHANGTAHAADDVKPPQAGKVAPEIKSMFFISQAINGEYLKRHLGDDDKVKSPEETAAVRRGAAMSPKYNIFGFPPRNSLDKQSDRRTVEKPPKIFQEPSAMKIQPNKLSERIVKCLVCIFIRLLRSSRVAELEKSGNLARSGNLQGSFRIDTGLNVTGSVAKDKERGQQDHYGIFGILDSVVRDIGPYKNLVRFTSSSFDLRGFSSSPLLTKLREMLEALQQVDLRFLTHQQKLAFWLNIYNTCIMHGILQHGLPSNSEKLLALKNKGTINVSGQMFNALVVENFILRQPSSVKEEFWKCDVDVEEQEVRGLYGLNNSEPNILFALCCGIRSSPALRIYKPDRIIMDLEKAKLDYLQASLVVTSTRKLIIPSLIHSNMHDFAKDMESLVRWICDQLPTSWSLRKSMVDCLRGQSHSKIEGVVDVIPYDYEFQYLLPM